MDTSNLMPNADGFRILKQSGISLRGHTSTQHRGYRRNGGNSIWMCSDLVEKDMVLKHIVLAAESSFWYCCRFLISIHSHQRDFEYDGRTMMS